MGSNLAIQYSQGSVQGATRDGCSSGCANREAAQSALDQASEPLPHRDRVQSSFGRHDLSEARATIGGPAARAGAQLGAVAFTSGDRTAFVRAPDVGLAAHEAAHIVQQRHGVDSPGDVRPGDDLWERQAEGVAAVVVAGRSAEPILDRFSQATTPTRTLQRQVERTPDFSRESKDEFAARVRGRASSRLTSNIATLGLWSAYVREMQGFQLRAQLMTARLSELATTAQQTAGGRQRFEEMSGTANPFRRSFRESELAVGESPRARAGSFLGFLSSEVHGYQTTPSIAERAQVLSGRRAAEDLSPSRFVGPNPRYSEYAAAIRRWESGESGGCQTCHDINLAWQRTAEIWGDPLPRDDLGLRFPSAMLTNGPGFAGGAGGRLTTRDRDILLNYIQRAGTSGTTPDDSGGSTQVPAPTQIAAPIASGAFTGPPASNPWVPKLAVPRDVAVPAPRSDLCGDIPSAQDAERIPSLASWGPYSSMVAEAIAQIDAVLTPLGPRGYRVLGRENFDALYAMTPESMTGVRDGILARIVNRQQQYTDLIGDIGSARVPYEELCPIVDELLPSTNDYVRAMVNEDVRRWRQRERLLLVLELILIGLSVLYPPALAITVPLGVGLGLQRTFLGLDQLRQGEQWSRGLGAGVYSASQEAQAPGLSDRGTMNVVTGLIGFGISALSTARLIAEVRASAEMIEALQSGAVITNSQFPGLTLLARNGRFVMLNDAGQILGFGMLKDGRIWWTTLPAPFTYGGTGTAATGMTVPFEPGAMIPYGPGAITPYGPLSNPLAPFSPLGPGGLAPYRAVPFVAAPGSLGPFALGPGGAASPFGPAPLLTAGAPGPQGSGLLGPVPPTAPGPYLPWQVQPLEIGSAQQANALLQQLTITGGPMPLETRGVGAAFIEVEGFPGPREMRAISSGATDVLGQGAPVYHATTPQVRSLPGARYIGGSSGDFPGSHINDVEQKLLHDIGDRLRSMPPGTRGTIHIYTVRSRLGGTVIEPLPACASCTFAAYAFRAEFPGITLVFHAPSRPLPPMDFLP